MTKKTDLVSDLDRDEIINVQMHEKDLQALINLLNLTHDTYNRIVDTSIKNGEDNAAALFLNRSKLAFALSERLNEYLDFAEPKSKELH